MTAPRGVRARSSRAKDLTSIKASSAAPEYFHTGAPSPEESRRFQNDKPGEEPMERDRPAYRPACQPADRTRCSQCSLAYECRGRSVGLATPGYALIAFAVVAVMAAIGNAV